MISACHGRHDLRRCGLIPIDFPVECSYYVLVTFGPRRRRSDGAFELRRSIFDIVYQIIPNGTARRPNPLALGNRPVNFLYMGLFLRFEKT